MSSNNKNIAEPKYQDEGKGQHQRRRSTLEVFADGVRQSLAMAEQKLHSHFMSTLALCFSVLSMFFLLINVFPYSGFMAMQLIPSLTEETAGTYAGILTSSFMVGRALSSYPWGKVADIYGRKFVLLISLGNSIIFSITFGFSTTFGGALMSRFLMGLGNGTMLVARTSISELARGDREKEAKSVGLMMSMVGYGMLLGPAIGGGLAEPTIQYPNLSLWFNEDSNGESHSTFSYDFLTKYPFVLPNLVASFVCFISMVFVVLCVEETLPEEKRRSPVVYLLSDICQFVFQIPMTLLFRRIRQLIFPSSSSSSSSSSWDDSNREIISNARRSSIPNNNNPNNINYQAIPSQDSNNEDGIIIENDYDYEADQAQIENDFKILQKSDPTELSALLSSRASRASYTMALHRPSLKIESSTTKKTTTTAPAAAAPPTEKEQQQQQRAKKASSDGGGAATISSLLSDKDTREHLIAYWVSCFANVAQSEAFPLFAMSKEGGLGLTESEIGVIGTGSGLLFCVCQYFIFSKMVQAYGLHKSMIYGAFLANIPVCLYPLSMLLPRQQQQQQDGGSSSSLPSWISLAYLSFLMGVLMIFNSVFYAGITVANNRTVEPSHRATMNGLSSLGASVGRGTAPLFAGVLVSFSMSSLVFPARFGSLVIYGMVTLVSAAAYYLTSRLAEEVIPEKPKESSIEV